MAKSKMEDAMQYEFERETWLLRETFEKSRVLSALTTYGERVERVMDAEMSALLGGAIPEGITVGELLGDLAPKTVYVVHMGLSLRYYVIPLSLHHDGKALVVGPYAYEPLSRSVVLEEGERLGISPGEMKYLVEYCESITVLGAENPLRALLDAFCERVFDAKGYDTVFIGERAPASADVPVTAIVKSERNEKSEDTLLKMVALERRYSFENEMIDAVRNGQPQKGAKMISALSELQMEKRTVDPIRSLKNYAIIMNTLLRKAAEEGGVHPVYIDSVSSDFAKQIEQISAPADAPKLMQEIFLSYARLVRKHATRSYSPIVQKAMMLVESDLCAEHSLSSLAEAQSISAGYLSALFKKETGKTVSEFIRGKRVAHAAHLFATTHLQVQTVALHCGIDDVQYFSKIFKREMGKTPKEYRESVKKQR